MKITILCVGKIKEKFYRDAVAEYEKRLSRYCRFEVTEVADEKTPDHASENMELLIKEKEAERMEKYLKDTYGITVYQEQVMLLSRLLADFTRGESDALRKAMGKKLRDKLDHMKDRKSVV